MSNIHKGHPLLSLLHHYACYVMLMSHTHTQHGAATHLTYIGEKQHVIFNAHLRCSKDTCESRFPNPLPLRKSTNLQTDMSKNNPVQIPEIPSRELTYPIPRHFWRWLSVFPRWDMLVPRRGTYWAAPAETQLLQFDGTVPRLFQWCSISQSMHLKTIRPVRCRWNSLEVSCSRLSEWWWGISMEKIYDEHVLRICRMYSWLYGTPLIERIDPPYSRSKLSS